MLKWPIVLALVMVLLSAAKTSAQEHPAANLPVPRTTLSPAERARAVQIASPQQPALSVFSLSSQDRARTVISNVQAVGAGKTDKQLALVTIYQYQGNITLNRVVDLGSNQIVSEERIPNGAAPLAAVEVEYARSLALANDRVIQLVAPFHDTAKLEFLLTTTMDQNSPWFGKRTVSAVIRTPRGYVSGPQITVNLTDGRVNVE